MKANRVAVIFLLLLSAAVSQLPAQQSEADRKLLDEIRAGAEQGDGQSQFELGRAFFFGKLGVAKDYVEAVKWCRKAAEQNNAEAKFLLGVCFKNGNGVEKDYTKALDWYQQAAEQGEAEAQFHLGFMFKFGLGTTADLGKALKWHRRAADQGDAEAQFELGIRYENGQGMAKDYKDAVKWYRKAAEQNLAAAQLNLGFCYAKGQGVAKDYVEAVKWYRKAAEQDDADAEYSLGMCYREGRGVPKDNAEMVKWYCKAAEQNHAWSQLNLGASYVLGRGLVKDYVEGYKWVLLAAAQGNAEANKLMAVQEREMTREQIAEGQKLARNFRPRAASSAAGNSSNTGIAQTRPESSGSGFLISEDGFLITNEHVVRDAAQVRLVTSAGLISAKVVKVDAANDLALLKAEGRFAALPVAASRAVKLGGTVATVGFPNIGLQGFAPKLAKGEIASLSGAGDDSRYFQISVPVQPGNSGGALVDERGNVVGVVSAKLNAGAALRSSGALPENVNYAVKSSYLLSFLESVPEVAAKLKEPSAKDKKFEDVVKEAEQAAVLVLVY